MKPIIIRKPKFMRDDSIMKIYIEVAETLSKEACRPEVTLERRVDLMKKVSEFTNKAAKAGGFLNAGDMFRWMELHTTA